MYILPAPSAVTSLGPFSNAAVAMPPSPLDPDVPVPAKVVIMGVAAVAVTDTTLVASAVPHAVVKV
jgi:hypothetical protein